LNSETKYAKEYHEQTKHSEISIQQSPHYLDWNTKPLPFKIYADPSVLLVPLPTDFSQPSLSALTSIGKNRPLESKNIEPDVKDIAEVLFFSAGITRELKVGHDTYYMRAASATGALYPIELYVICQDLPGLRAGVYHFSPADFSLAKLRSGDYRTELANVAGNDSDIARSPFTIAFTSIAWRNSWKYQARSYRHWFWDSGVIAANLMATAISIGFDPRLKMGFVDDAVNLLLRLDDKKEAAIILAAIGMASATEPINETKGIDAMSIPKIVSISRGSELDYPEIWRLHRASYLHNKEEVRSWSDRSSIALDQTLKDKVSDVTRVQGIKHAISLTNESSLGETILLRGSTRKFSRRPISMTQLSNILHYSTRGVPIDFLRGKSNSSDDNNGDNSNSTIDTYLIANDVEGLQTGAYFFDRYEETFEKLERRASRNLSAYLCLGQSLFGDASVVFFLMADLNFVLHILGNRGYRASQFEAGVIAGKIYLASYAQKIGASGSTFFDDAVSEFFSPHAANKSAMIAIGVGVPDYQARPGKILAGRLSRSQVLPQ
jgi:SagB-type dehydrogenase family enzyme